MDELCEYSGKYGLSDTEKGLRAVIETAEAEIFGKQK